MAITKIKPIRDRLHRVIKYILIPDKNGEKLYASVLNCDSLDTAEREMVEAQNYWDCKDKVVCYHLIQSFKPNETTPEVAHKIGIELCNRLFHNYQCVISTHIDHEHIHNHICFNSVSFLDGTKYQNSFKDYFHDIRKTSDLLCMENKLSVIEKPNAKGKHYAEWNAEKNNKPTIRSLVKADIEFAIKNSYGSWYMFERYLDILGYQIKQGQHLSIKAPFAERFVRLDRMGYSKENINNRLANWKPIYHYTNRNVKRYKYKGNLSHIRPYKTGWSIFFDMINECETVWVKDGGKWRHKTDEEIFAESLACITIGSFCLVFSIFILLLKMITKVKTPPSITGFLKNNVIKLDKYQNQFEVIKSGKTDDKIKGTAIDIVGKLAKIQELEFERKMQRNIQKQDKEQDYER